MPSPEDQLEPTDYTRRDFLRMTGLACLSLNDVIDQEINQATITDSISKRADLPSPDDNSDERQLSAAQDSCYYDEIVTHTGRLSDTDYYITTVPKHDTAGDLIRLHVAHHPYENPLEHAATAHTTLTINGNCTILMKDGSYRTGITIGDGVVLSDNTFMGEEHEFKCPILYEKYIGVTDDRIIKEYDMRLGFESSLTAEHLLSEGCTNVFNCYFKLMEKGEIVDVDNFDPPIQWNNGEPVRSDRRLGPMMIMGVKQNGDLVFLATDGRSPINAGLTYSEVVGLLVKQDCTDAYVLDGGGSVSMILRGSKINRNVDGRGAQVRNIRYSIDFRSESDNLSSSATQLFSAYEQVGVEKQRTIAQVAPYLDYLNSQLITKKGDAIPRGANLNDYTHCGKYYSASASVSGTLMNCPVVNRGFTLFVIQTGQHDENYTQFLLTNTPMDIYHRVVYPTGGVYRKWIFVSGQPQNVAAIIEPGETVATTRLSVNWQASVTWSSSEGSMGYVHLSMDNESGLNCSTLANKDYLLSILSFDVQDETLLITNKQQDGKIHVMVVTSAPV